MKNICAYGHESIFRHCPVCASWHTCKAGHVSPYRVCLKCEEEKILSRIVPSERFVDSPIANNAPKLRTCRNGHLTAWKGCEVCQSLKASKPKRTIADLAAKTPLSEAAKARAKRVADKMNAKAIAMARRVA